MKIVLCGEAWGKNEATFQHPLVGASGRELTLEMGISKLAPFMNLLCRNCKQITQFLSTRCEHCQQYVWPSEFDLIEHWKRLKNEYQINVTNVFNVKPPDFCVDCGTLNQIQFVGRFPVCKACGSKNARTNELGYFFGTSPETIMPSWKASRTYGGSHLKNEYFFHIKRLWRELDEAKPNLVIALGNAACWVLLGQTKITVLRGTVARTDKELTELDIKCLPTFHPAAVLRQMPMRVSVIADLTKAKREAEFPEIRRPERWITIIDNTKEGISEGYEWFKRSAPAYAVDIETHGGQITMVGFARAKDDALVITFRNQGNGGNFWPTDDLEVQAWKLVMSGLGSPVPKIFQNGIYDLSYFIRMGIHVKNIQHDTMLWHHSEYLELPKSLGYLGSMYANEVAWKSMVRHESLKRDE